MKIKPSIILWIGPVVAEDELHTSKALSPAANQWQIHCLEALKEKGQKLILLSYLPEPSWPGGDLWVSDRKVNFYTKGLDVISTGYLNISGLREISISIGLVLKSFSLMLSGNNKLIFSYNPLARHRFTGMLLRLVGNAKWYSVVADHKAKGRPDGTVFLSYGYYQKYKRAEKYFLDGGVSPKLKNEFVPGKPRYILFAGALNKWTGITEFAKTYTRICNDIPFELELHIYGKGEDKFLKQLAMENERIKLFGFVSSAELDKACSEAFLFVNPRPVKIRNGENNFPSKLLMYLSYGKPVLSTKTGGLAPKYDQVLNYFNSESELLETIHTLSDEQNFKARVQQIEEFVYLNNWNKQVSELLIQINEAESM